MSVPLIASMTKSLLFRLDLDPVVDIILSLSLVSKLNWLLSTRVNGSGEGGCH